jgi:regulator of protease activity HflC (stomatin/prohibitin superfamily)
MVLVVPFLLLACDSVAPSPGEEIVLVKKPYIFGRGGIEPQPVRAGRVFIAPSTDEIAVNVYPTTIKEAFTDLMSSDQQPLDFDTAIQVQVTSSVDLVRNFGLEWYQNKVAPQYRSIVRQSVRRRTMTEMTLNPAAIEATDREVFDVLSRYMREQKLPVRLIDVTLGRANPPEEIKQQRIATATQKARQETEKERKLAEDQRAAAEESRARADNAYRTAMQLSPEQFLQLESIKMQREVCANPKNPCTFFLGGSAVPTLPVR